MGRILALLRRSTGLAVFLLPLLAVTGVNAQSTSSGQSSIQSSASGQVSSLVTRFVRQLDQVLSVGRGSTVAVNSAVGVQRTLASPHRRITNAEREAAAAAQAQRRQTLEAMGLMQPLKQSAYTGVAPIFAAPLAPGQTDYLGGSSPNYAYSPAPAVDATTGAISGGIRKFVDTLPGLGPQGANNLGNYIPVATPDTTTYPGSDYYEIGLRDYRHQFHTDLPVDATNPGTLLRGYYQKNVGGTGTDGPNAYLGPVILAKENQAVRIKFSNELAAGAAGNLFIPVDSTVMGAGAGPLDTAGNACDPATGTCASYTQNRATLHLHGGNSPWISDGTPHQWVVPAAETSPFKKGASAMNVPDMPDPGPGNLTFYYTNQQSSRLMFYHDHALGLTRLNVYAGEAAGYLIYSDAESALITAGVLPDNGGGLNTFGIPLIIQDKTFLPDPASLAYQDPTWAWGPVDGTGNFLAGNLWFPHVYMPNQNPNDLSGANPFGRWDYGAWFWPPVTTLANQPITITGTGTFGCPVGQICELPNVPNPSIVPEAFMDTPLVNGAAYPTVTLEPKAYRFRILNAANDRFWNLSWFQADTTVTASTGIAGTEVKMVDAVPRTLCGTLVAGAPLAANCTCNPADALNGSPAGCFPASWPTDGRAGGVPDAASMGPAFVQIGTEGGFLPAPVVIPPQPVNYNYNRRDIVVLNVTDHGLFLGPAERADVVVDFSAFAGKTLILYNDSPAPVPAFDSRNDYYTGNPDQTSTGGAKSTLAGYGPNTRTIMQVVIAPSAPAAPYDMTALNTAFASTGTSQGVFQATQPTIPVPQSVYSTAYGQTLTDTFARIQSTSLSFTPVGGAAPVTVPLVSKAIQELFELDYGRMNATLGVELPFTNFLTQTTIPFAFIDPVTEEIADGQPQYWKITHNGVDTHAIHFHLMNVQIVNRVGWDGAVRPPDANEIGWKDTVRMNPLEDAIVAMRPVKQKLPWPLPDSVRLLNPTMPQGSTAGFTGIDPLTNGALAVSNQPTNLGWEYVWHCHLLGHEENDMMRTVSFLVNAEAPSNLVANASLSVEGVIQVGLSWQDNAASESGFRVERAPSGGAFTALGTVGSSAGYGASVSFLDTTAQPNTSYDYRVIATKDHQSIIYGTQLLDSVPSNTATVLTPNPPPPAPTSLHTITVSSNQVWLAWSQSGTYATSFHVQRASTSTFTTNVVDFTSATTAFTDTTVLANTTYYYRVWAVGSGGQSVTSSNVLQVKTAPPNRPSAPSALVGTPSAGGVTPVAVALTWRDNSTNETGFTVQRATNSAFTAGLVTFTTPPNGTASVAYADATVANSTVYWYRVRAFNTSGTSGWSNTIQVATVGLLPTAPTGLTIVGATTTSISMNWTAVLNATSYNVQMQVGGVWTSVGTTTATGFTVWGLTSKTTYSFRVAGRNALGTGAYSATITGTTL
jgi:FtsP/CotA-like multicopper oxidase with cupredoxin domain/fibronectin type 3 domain-containing protein